MRLQTRLLAGILTLLVLMVVVPWALASVFLEPYSRWESHQRLVESTRTLLTLDPTSPTFTSSVDALDPGHTLRVVLTDADRRVLVHRTPGGSSEPSSAPAPGPGDPPPPPPPPRTSPVFLPDREMEGLAPGALVESVKWEPGLGIETLLVIARYQTGQYLVVSLPLRAVKEAARTAVSFLALVGAAALVPGVGLSVWWSRRLTRPLRELRRLAVEVERQKVIDGLRRDFIASASHELKTPVTLILGYAEGLADVADSPQKRVEYRDVILDEARKLDQQVRDLGEIHRWVEGPEPATTRVDLADQARAAVDRFHSRFAAQGVEVEVTATGETSVEGDEAGLVRVIENFLKNALDHGTSPGVIAVSVRRVQDRVRLEVFNTGPLVPDQDRDRIWESYSKLATPQRGFSGTGLGLAIVKGIVDRHRGTCGCDGRQSPEGMAFWAEFPAY